MKKRLLKVVLAVIVLVALWMGGCANTLHGFGSLTKGVGQDIQDAAQSQYSNSRTGY
jgi:predicted small secreted protein